MKEISLATGPEIWVEFLVVKTRGRQRIVGTEVRTNRSIM